MKKLLTLLFAGMLTISCTDYDSKFDALNAQIEELMAANEALEAQVLGLAAAQAQIAQATALQLQGFQAQVAAIAELLQTVSDSNVELESLIDTLTAQIEAITAEVAAVAESIETSDAANAEANDALKALLDSITASLAEVQAQLDEIQVVVEAIHHSGGGSDTSGGSTAHHSGGGSHTSGGSAAHHSGGGSTTDSGTEEHTSGGTSNDSSSTPTTTSTDVTPDFTGVFGGFYAQNNVYKHPSGQQTWAGVANLNTSFYPLEFDTADSKITFKAQITGTGNSANSVGLYFKFENKPSPNNTAFFVTETVTVTTTEQEFTVAIPQQAAGNTWESMLLYLDVLDVEVTVDGGFTMTVVNSVD
jgi:outer membrane murein-binding lipoprotein Lpp